MEMQFYACHLGPDDTEQVCSRIKKIIKYGVGDVGDDMIKARL